MATPGRTCSFGILLAVSLLSSEHRSFVLTLIFCLVKIHSDFSPIWVAACPCKCTDNGHYINLPIVDYNLHQVD